MIERQSRTEVRKALRDNRPVRSLAALVAVAVADGLEMLDDPLMRPDHGLWWSPGSNGCAACLAGAVIRGTLSRSVAAGGIDATTLAPVFGDQTGNALRALDDLRNGYLFSAYGRLGRDGMTPDVSNDAVQRLIQDRTRNRDLHVVACPGFKSREGFRAHLDSLETLIPELEKLETTVSEEEAA